MATRSPAATRRPISTRKAIPTRKPTAAGSTRTPTYLSFDDDEDDSKNVRKPFQKPPPPVIARPSASIARASSSATAAATTIAGGGAGGGGVVLWLILFIVPVLLVAAWLYSVSVTQGRFPKLRNKRICLLIAHPDDEAMFFAPSVVALTEPSLGNHVKILCLSSGDADGLGQTRKRELVKSGLALGLRQEDDVFVIESVDFQDSMTTEWSAPKISNLLSSAFAPNLQKPSSPTSSTQPTATIDVLITFDSAGISSHPNHISLFHGARHFIKSLIESRPGWDCPVALYTLTTVGMARKYASIADVVISMVATSFGKQDMGNRPSPLMFVSGAKDVRRAQRAMTDAHISQMRWFRWGWIGFSRYMVMNELRLEKFVPARAAD